MPADSSYLYHVTDSAAAAQIHEQGFQPPDQLARAHTWNIPGNELMPDDWDLPADVPVPKGCEALGSYLLAQERLDGHPERSQATFFHPTIEAARRRVERLDMTAVCIVDPSGIDAPIAAGRGATVTKFYHTLGEAVRGDAAHDLAQLRALAHEYWLSVHEWATVNRDGVEVFIPGELAPTHIEAVVDDPQELVEYANDPNPYEVLRQNSGR